MRPLVLVLVASSAALAHADEAPLRLRCLQRHYPMELVEEAGAWKAKLPNGVTVPWDDGADKTLDEALEHPDLEDTLRWRYRPGPIRPVTDPSEDPGRVRVDPLFVATYPTKEVAPVEFMGKRLQIHRRVAPAFAKVAARLVAARDADWTLAPWLSKFSGTFVVRKIAGTDRASSHSYGISIDLDAGKTHYWRWQRPATPIKWRNDVPQAIVDAFEAEGFIWGGRWYHYDTMHFEYRPELLDPGCRP